MSRFQEKRPTDSLDKPRPAPHNDWVSTRDSSAALASDPLLQLLESAPIDDEPVTEEQARRIRAAEDDAERGAVVDHETAKRLFLGE